MLKTISILGLLAIAMPVKTARAQMSSSADQDSIEIAAARFARSKLPASSPIVLEPRVRTPDGWSRGRSEAQIARLISALGARIGTLGCGVDPSGCTPLDQDIGIALQTPKVSGGQATITVEHYLKHALGSETYLVVRDGTRWTVSRILSRSAT
jgi:hypothetical protein